MNSLEIANDPTGEKFLEAYREVELAKKCAINTAPYRIDQQIERFRKTSFDEKDVEALHEDAMTV